MQRHYHETVHYVIAGPRAQRDRGRHRGLGGGRLHLHAAVDLAPALQRLGRRAGRVPHHRELPPAAGARHHPPAERRACAPSPRRGPDSRRTSQTQGTTHERPARAHQHLGRAGRHRPRTAPRRRRAACAPACCAPGPAPTWCCCTAPAATWRPTPVTSPGLAADFRVTAYDMVGHGWSDLPDRPYTIDVLCDHLIGLLDALDIASAHLSGESLGGWVAAWTAAHHPDRVGRLVLNTPGNIANKPEVMARLRDSTHGRGPRPERRDRAPPGRVPVPPHRDGHRRAGQPAPRRLQPAGLPDRRSATRWCCRTRRSARTSPGIRAGSARSPRRRCCCGPTTTRPAASTRRKCCSAGCPTPGCT